MDIVGLSDRGVSTKVQVRKIQTLNSIVMNSTTFRFTPRETMLVLPTGDGMAIGFLQGPELPLNLAIEIHRMLAKYNKAKIPAETIRVRIGIHSGSTKSFKRIVAADSSNPPYTWSCNPLCKASIKGQTNLFYFVV